MTHRRPASAAVFALAFLVGAACTGTGPRPTASFPRSPSGPASAHDSADNVQEVVARARLIDLGAVKLPTITPFANSGRRAVILWLDDVVYAIDQAWEPAFKRAGLRYDSVGWGAVDLPRQGVASNCREPLSGRPIGPFPHGAPFYCPAGGDVVTGNVDHGVIYFGALGISDIAVRLLGSDVIHQPVTFDLLVYILVGHEMGHHVQTELLNRKPWKTLGQAWLELGADCLSGVYIHHAWPPPAFRKPTCGKL